LPRPPVLSLGRSRFKELKGSNGAVINVETAPQLPDELAINGNPTTIPSGANKHRNPFVLLIDDVLDPGNLGAIIRSAYFLGVDAIAISTRTCAPITPAALKASAGAAEGIPILNVANAPEFLKNSHNAGWRIYCGTTPDTPLVKSISPRDPNVEPLQVKYTKKDGNLVPQTFWPLKYSSSILVVGGEGKGINRYLTHYAWAFAEIMPKMDVNECGVDSLNVSVAAALLCADILRPRPLLPPKVVVPVGDPKWVQQSFVEGEFVKKLRIPSPTVGIHDDASSNSRSKMAPVSHETLGTSAAEPTENLSTSDGNDVLESSGGNSEAEETRQQKSIAEKQF
jgi:21S rRNA (GM2251-2'-O)-methyltransferase